MIRVLCVALVVSACGSSNTDLAGLPHLRVVATSYDELDRDDDNLRRSSIQIELAYDVEAFVAQHGDCAIIDDVGATLDHIDVELGTSGGADEWGECESPRLGLSAYNAALMNIGIAADHTLEISDSSRTVRAQFPAGSLARIATPSSHSEWSFAAGETVTLAWSHPTDFAELGPVWSHLGVWLHRGSEYDHIEMPAISHSETEIAFAVPSPAPFTGEGFIELFIGNEGGPFILRTAASSCTGADACTAAVTPAYDHTVQIRN